MLWIYQFSTDELGPVIQSIISLTNSLVVKMLKKCEKLAKAIHIFSAKISAYLPYLMTKILTIC